MDSPPTAMFSFSAGYRGKSALSSALGHLGWVPARTLALPKGQLAFRDQGARFEGRDAEQDSPLLRPLSTPWLWDFLLVSVPSTLWPPLQSKGILITPMAGLWVSLTG